MIKCITKDTSKRNVLWDKFYSIYSKSIKVAVLTTSGNLGTWLENNQILSGEKMCVLALNGAQNNPLGQCYAIIIHSVGYWSKHPQYIKLSGNTITTGVLDCTDTANITIHA